MGVDFFARCLQLQREHRRPGQTILNTIQTNATLVDDTWARFLADNDFLVGVSIDGPARCTTRTAATRAERPRSTG